MSKSVKLVCDGCSTEASEAKPKGWWTITCRHRYQIEVRHLCEKCAAKVLSLEVADDDVPQDEVIAT